MALHKDIDSKQRLRSMCSTSMHVISFILFTSSIITFFSCKISHFTVHMFYVLILQSGYIAIEWLILLLKFIAKNRDNKRKRSAPGGLILSNPFLLSRLFLQECLVHNYKVSICIRCGPFQHALNSLHNHTELTTNHFKKKFLQD